MNSLSLAVLFTIVICGLLIVSTRRFVHKQQENAFLYLVLSAFVWGFSAVMFKVYLWILLVVVIVMTLYIGLKIRKHKKLFKRQKNHGFNIITNRYGQWAAILIGVLTLFAILGKFVLSKI